MNDNCIATTIRINDLRLYGHHGVMPQERAVGNDFSLSLSLQLAGIAVVGAKTDNLSLTLSYADVIDVVRQEMAVPSQLLENVVWRIINRLKREFLLIEAGEVTLLKLTPPCGVEVAGVGVTMRF